MMAAAIMPLRADDKECLHKRECNREPADVHCEEQQRLARVEHYRFNTVMAHFC